MTYIECDRCGTKEDSIKTQIVKVSLNIEGSRESIIRKDLCVLCADIVKRTLNEVLDEKAVP